ncbi:MAG TPA: hypothetical protein VJ852_09515 [Gemmatimonadaceae bacterium]|nr:hypothetical protein [Gemmatimonadaceae bacterium]
MRTAILLCCGALVGCARGDDHPSVATRASTVTASSTAIVDSQPIAEKPWAPDSLPSPGDTTPTGFPTEKALLRWVHLLPIDSFPDLPSSVRTTLVQRQCQIPVPGRHPSNVIKGAFTAKGATEWAVLCSVNDTSQILILNATSGAVLDSLNKSANAGWIQSYVTPKWLFSRVIALVPVHVLNVVPPDSADEDVLNYSAWFPKPIDHDAIDQYFIDKAGETYYFAQGRWFSTISSD